MLQRPLFCRGSLFYVTQSFHHANALGAIIENGSQPNNTMHSKHCLTSVTLPDSVTIFGTNINVHVDEVGDGELGNLTESRISLETLILRNHTKIKRNMEYDIQFICCSCKITEIERKHIMRKHRKKKHMYDSMEPVVKKKVSRRH